MNYGKFNRLEIMKNYPNGRFMTKNNFFGYWAKIKGQGNKLVPIFGIQTKEN
jgi:hypothetical protein